MCNIFANPELSICYCFFMKVGFFCKSCTGIFNLFSFLSNYSWQYKIKSNLIFDFLFIFEKQLFLSNCKRQGGFLCWNTMAEIPKFCSRSFFCFLKGQIISECPYEIIVYPKIATKKFPRFLPWPLRRGQTKNFIKPIMLNNP